MCQVMFIDKNGKQYEYAEFHAPEDQDLYDKLEEVLYIICELTPAHRNWKKDLKENHECLFTYHNCEHQILRAICSTLYEVVDI